MRQSVQERRIAVQLMQLRREKDVIRRNRLAQEKQFEEARVKEFEESLNKEKVASNLLIVSVLFRSFSFCSRHCFV